MEHTIESIRAGDAETRHGLMRQAFGGTYVYDGDAPAYPADQVVCAYAGDRLAGAVSTVNFEMTWGGRPVPCGGVSGVAVSPEDRGKGLARRMLGESFARMGARGQTISALYPTTASLYRSMGYEVVAMWARRWLELSLVPAEPAAALAWERVGLDDPRLGALIDAHAAVHDGWITLDPVFWAWRVHMWSTEKGNRFAYIGSDDTDARAALVFSYAPADGARDLFDLVAEVVAAPYGPDMSAALGFLAGHTTTAGRAQTTVPASVLARHLPQPQRADNAQEWPWMLRIVDAPGAIAARGYPRGVAGRVELALTDDVIEGNDGRFVLEIADGQATLTPGGSGRLGLRIRDLALVYAGGTRSLVAAGAVDVGPDDADLLTAAFSSDPTLPIFF